MKKIIQTSVVTAVTIFLAFGLIGSITVLAASPSAVDLGASGHFAILTKSGISTTGATQITGDIGVSPIAATAITGFGLIKDISNTFSTTALVTGKVYAADYTAPTPTNMNTAIRDMQTAYTDAAGRTNPTATELGAGNIGGLTFAPGLYKWGTSVTIPTDVTLTGGANDVWIFQIAQTLTVGSGTKVVLSGGAQANNIFWVVAGQTTIGTTAVFNGNILDQTAIVLNTGATLNGRALAQTAVTLDANSVTIPSASAQTPTPPPTPPPTPTPVLIPAPAPTPVPQPTNPSTNNESESDILPVAEPVIPTSPINNENIFVPAPTIPVIMDPPIKTIMTNLYQGYRGPKVKILQQFLISQNKGPAARALSRIGATAYFGRYTRAALAEWQKQAGIYAHGNFGPITRAYLAQ